jgi:Tfp pilus assembly protein PilX
MEALYDRLPAEKYEAKLMKKRAQEKQGTYTMEQSLSTTRRREHGVALITVLMLSAICIVLVSTLMYMTMMGTKASGSQKRYKTALEASYAGLDVATQIIQARADVASFITGSISSLAGFQSNVPAACSGTANNSGIGVAFTGVAAKIMTASSTWAPGSCGDTSLSTSGASYDFIFTLGTSPQFNVYTKIVDVVEGNTGAGGKVYGHRLTTTQVASTTNEIQSGNIPFLYTLEIDSENTATSQTANERSGLSVLYQY